MAKTEKKPRAKKYDKPLAINATFDQVIKIAVGKKEEVKKEIDQKKC